MRRKKRLKNKRVMKKKLKIVIDLLLNPTYRKYVVKAKQEPLEKVPPGTGGIAVELLRLIREGIVSQRHVAVASILMLYFKRQSNNYVNIYKAGLQVINHKGDLQLREDFTRAFLDTPNLSSKEVILDYIIALLQDGLLAEAEEAIMTLSSQKLKLDRPCDNQKSVNLLLRGYEGLIHYTVWHKMIKEQVDSEELLEQCLNETSRIQRLSQLAVNNFSFLVKEPGVWDIFITKYLHILVTENRLDEAEEMLREYISNNRSHCHARLYLCEFLERYNGTYKKQVKALKSLLKIAPYHNLLHRLIKKVKWSNKEIPYCITQLFKYLDYSQNAYDELAWKTLFELTSKTFDSEDKNSRVTLIECWDKRSSWWLQYHFTYENIAAAEHRKKCKVIYYKACFASYFLNRKHRFFKRVKAYFNVKMPYSYKKFKAHENSLREKTLREET